MLGCGPHNLDVLRQMRYLHQRVLHPIRAFAMVMMIAVNGGRLIAFSATLPAQTQISIWD